VAVVRADRVVFARGYGVREAGRAEPVDENTLFAIGSNTKLFTAVLTGMLVDEGRMSWDDPASRHLPGFQLFDPYVSREIRIHDLLSHRSGLGRRGDFLWYASPFDRREILRRVRFLEPNSSFRSEFGYQNIMFLAAGEAAAEAAGRDWDTLVRERIFTPLGMTRSNTSTNDLSGDANVASPHAWRDGEIVPIPYRNIDNVAPAGSINSSAREMAEWLRMLLARGSYEGNRLLEPATLARIESPHTITPLAPDSLTPSTHFSAYGLGIGMRDYRGVKVLSHTGGIDGMLSLVAYVPERDLGIVVLTNTSPHNALYTAIMYRVLDAYLGGESRDWSGILLDRTREAEARQAETRARTERERVPGTRPSLELAAYVGTYSNEMYGDVSITESDGRLHVRYGTAFRGELEHWHYDTFVARWDDEGLGTSYVTFALTPMATVGRMEIQGLADFQRIQSPGSQGGGM
jgi:CubicO group peptidase (beta-lactamase class C family)